MTVSSLGFFRVFSAGLRSLSCKLNSIHDGSFIHLTFSLIYDEMDPIHTVTGCKEEVFLRGQGVRTETGYLIFIVVQDVGL